MKQFSGVSDENGFVVALGAVEKSHGDGPGKPGIYSLSSPASFRRIMIGKKVGKKKKVQGTHCQVCGKKETFELPTTS